jgi:hypothetical protein
LPAPVTSATSRSNLISVVPRLEGSELIRMTCQKGAFSMA